MSMTLEQVRDVLRNAGRFDIYGADKQACDLADAIDAHLTQPAQSVDVEKVREVIEWLRDSGFDPVADKLARAIGDEP